MVRFRYNETTTAYTRNRFPQISPLTRFRALTKTTLLNTFTSQLNSSSWSRLAPRRPLSDLERDTRNRYIPDTFTPESSTRASSISSDDTESTLTLSPSIAPWPWSPAAFTPAAVTPSSASSPQVLTQPLTDTPNHNSGYLHTMADITSMSFTGKPEDEDPQDFMNRLELIMMLRTGLTAEEDKVRLLRLSLKAKSPAHAWWATLTPTDTATFKAVRQAFFVRWPIKAIVEKTTAEKQATLDATILKTTDLGKRVAASKGGEEEWTHIVWADKVERLANDIPDVGNLLVPGVRKNLPKPIIKLVGLKPMTWKELCDNVREITHEELMAQVEDEHDRLRSLAIHTAPDTPSKVLGAAFQNINLKPGQRQYTLANTTYQPRAQRSTTPNSFIERPAHVRLADVLQKALPIHPNTAEGITLYNLQIVEWHATHGQNGPSETRPYPLSPGTAPVASGECWTCGHPSHLRAACSKPRIPAFETKWRSIAQTIRRRAEQAAPAANVNVVGAEEEAVVHTYDPDDLIHLQHLINQGNEQGSST